MIDNEDEYRKANDDSLGTYLKKIRNIPPLTRQEEIELARRIQKGDTEAERELVCHNLKFVAYMASRYKGYGLPLPDIINEGNIGLIQAAKRFDPDRGVKFITYAVWWIRQAIMRAMAEQANAVRLPIKQTDLLHKINSKHQELRNDLCREPSGTEVAEALGLSPGEMESVLRAYRSRLALDAPIREGEDTNYLDLMEDTHVPPVEDQIIRNAIAREVRELLHELPPREEDVLRMRFGFEGMPKSLQEIGCRLNLSRERIRQIERKAMSRLRARKKSRALAQ